MRSIRTPVRPGRIYCPAAIGERRRARSMTQRELARIMGLALSRIQSFEQGYRRPTPDMLGALADTLDCSVDSFFSLAEPGRTGGPQAA